MPGITAGSLSVTVVMAVTSVTRVDGQLVHPIREGRRGDAVMRLMFDVLRRR
jgi:hypothetical protein